MSSNTHSEIARRIRHLYPPSNLNRIVRLTETRPLFQYGMTPTSLTEEKLLQILIYKYEKTLWKMRKATVAADNRDRLDFSECLKHCDANIEEIHKTIDQIQKKGVIARKNYQTFLDINDDSITIKDVKQSSAGINVWYNFRKARPDCLSPIPVKNED